MHIGDLLEENALARYMEMFNRFDPDAIRRSDWFIRSVFDVFKGNRERLTWAFKWLRGGLAVNFRNDYDGMDQLIKSYETMLRSKRPEIMKNANYLLHNLSFFTHYFDLKIPEIDNFVYGVQKPADVVKHFQEIEKVWQDQSSGLLPPDAMARPILTTGRFTWFDLQRNACALEGRAMGHCGNGEGQPDETVLSLREQVKKDGKTMYRPCLTFVLNKSTGSLGEMKGRNNSKPSTKYHPYILALLIDYPTIKALEGGGYKPDNNFSLSDLSPEKYMTLKNARPELVSESETKGCFARIRRDGEPFWIATFDLEGNIMGHYGLWLADRADFHEEFYMNKRDSELTDKGQYFWVQDGELHLGDYHFMHLRDKLLDQFNFTNPINH